MGTITSSLTINLNSTFKEIGVNPGVSEVLLVLEKKNEKMTEVSLRVERKLPGKGALEVKIAAESLKIN